MKVWENADAAEVKQKGCDSECNFKKSLKSYLNILSVVGFRGSLCVFLESETLTALGFFLFCFCLTYHTAVYDKTATVQKNLTSQQQRRRSQ